MFFRVYCLPCLLLCAACLWGCAPANQGPSYSELVTTYNAELEVLDRLERTREELIAKYETATRPKAADAGEALQSMLDSATEALRESARDTEGMDPEKLLDRVAGDNGVAEQLAGELRGALTGEAAADEELTPEEVEQRDALKREYEAQLAALDAEIAAQQERVEKARAARDAAQ